MNNAQVLTKRKLKELGTTTEEIFRLLASQAFVKMRGYKTKTEFFQKKHGMPFGQFKKKIEDAKEEIFEEWDDFILWEGFQELYEKWLKRYLTLQRYV